MKKSTSAVLFTISILCLLAFTGCKKLSGCTDGFALNYDAKAIKDDGSCKYNGDVTFWYDFPYSDGTVTINGQVGNITTYFLLFIPSCNSSGCANFALPEGTYSYTAINSSNTKSWSGNVTVTANGCQTVLLK